MTPADRRHINAWRGLTAAQLEELNALDHRALASVDGFAVIRCENIKSRLRCIALRAEHGLGVTERAR